MNKIVLMICLCLSLQGCSGILDGINTDSLKSVASTIRYLINNTGMG